MAHLKRTQKGDHIWLQPGTEPGVPYEGQVYYNTVLKIAYIYDGTNWNSVNSGFIGSGGIMSSFVDSGTTYMVHTYLTNGVFQASAGDVDFLVIAGGGGGA